MHICLLDDSVLAAVSSDATTHSKSVITRYAREGGDVIQSLSLPGVSAKVRTGPSATIALTEAGLVRVDFPPWVPRRPPL